VSLRVDPTVASLSSGAPPTPPLPSQPTATADDFPKVGVARVTTWQGKNLTSSYPVYLETTTNLMSSRRFRSQTVINPHNPIFDHVSVFDLTSLQGDIFLIVREVCVLLSLRSSRLEIETRCQSQPRHRPSGHPLQLGCRQIQFEIEESQPIEGNALRLVRVVSLLQAKPIESWRAVSSLCRWHPTVRWLRSDQTRKGSTLPLLPSLLTLNLSIPSLPP
jgi:hypothetical protein